MIKTAGESDNDHNESPFVGVTRAGVRGHQRVVSPHAGRDGECGVVVGKMGSTVGDRWYDHANSSTTTTRNVGMVRLQFQGFPGSQADDGVAGQHVDHRGTGWLHRIAGSDGRRPPTSAEPFPLQLAPAILDLQWSGAHLQDHVGRYDKHVLHAPFDRPDLYCPPPAAYHLDEEIARPKADKRGDEGSD